MLPLLRVGLVDVPADEALTRKPSRLLKALIGWARKISELVEELRREVARGSAVSWSPAENEALSLSLELPLQGPFDASAAADEMLRSATQQLDDLQAHRLAFRPGHVLNLRTGRAEGKDTLPPDSRFIFGGYSPSGQPRFLDFAQWLLQIEHPEQHLLYRKPPGLVTVITSGTELKADLLPIFQQAPADQRLHGQVTAGWYSIPDTDGIAANLAVTFQVLSTAVGRDTKKRRFGLNLLVAGPRGESSDEVHIRLDPVPWTSAAQWARQALASLERGARQDEAKTEQRIEGILGGLARRLAHQRRGRQRRTEHAEARHQSGRRPTRMALKDLDRAQDSEILADARQDTLIVLGDRGRVHVFNRAGKLVTSIRYNPDAIERKKKAEIWIPTAPAEIEQLRQKVAAHGAED